MRCRKGCSALISLKLQDGLYHVINFRNQHEHKVNFDKDLQFREITAFLERTHLVVGDVDAKKILMKTFNINERRYFYIKHKL